MTTLMVQTFLLLLTAFFAGATLACLLRRLTFGRSTAIAEAPSALAPATARVATAMTAPAAPMAPAAASPSRFENALSGVPSAPRPTPFIPQAPAAVAPALRPAAADNKFSPVVVGIAAAAGPALRQDDDKAAEAIKVVEPAPPRIMLPSAAGTSGANAVAAEVVSAAPAPVASAAVSDDLLRIRGIDSGLQSQLAALGVTSVAAIAGWKTADVANFSSKLGLDGRIERENWVEQAQILAKGAETYYSSRLKQDDVAIASSPSNEGRRAEAPPNDTGADHL